MKRIGVAKGLHGDRGGGAGLDHTVLPETAARGSTSLSASTATCSARLSRRDFRACDNGAAGWDRQKEHLSGISKRGDRYIRRLLVTGAFAVFRSKRGKVDPWLLILRGRKPPLVAAVALANKLARIAWASCVVVRRSGRGPKPSPREVQARHA